MNKPKKIEVTVRGIASLLQHRFPEEAHPEVVSKKRKKVYNDMDDAEESLYKNTEGVICQPAKHFESAMIKAATAFTLEGKKTYKDAFKGGIFVNPSLIPHKFQKWELDRQPVIIGRARIMRARPRFDEWELDFEIEIIDDRISTDVVKEVLAYAGLYCGVGDVRPRYGRFEIIKFNEI